MDCIAQTRGESRVEVFLHLTCKNRGIEIRFVANSPWSQTLLKKNPSWWLNQPIWKICSSNLIISPGRVEKTYKTITFSTIYNQVRLKPEIFELPPLISDDRSVSRPRRFCFSWKTPVTLRRRCPLTPVAYTPGIYRSWFFFCLPLQPLGWVLCFFFSLWDVVFLCLGRCSLKEKDGINRRADPTYSSIAPPNNHSYKCHYTINPDNAILWANHG